MMFSSTFRLPKMRRSSGTSCMPRRAMHAWASPGDLLAVEQTEPERGVTTPIRLFSVVLLPAPLRPSKATTSLRSTRSATSNRICESP
jgi:hypothetical protein